MYNHAFCLPHDTVPEGLCLAVVLDPKLHIWIAIIPATIPGKVDRGYIVGSVAMNLAVRKAINLVAYSMDRHS